MDGPEFGRFAGVDPLTQFQAEAFLHPYSYRMGDPVLATDPSGFAPPEWLARLLLGTAVHKALSYDFERIMLLLGHETITNQAVFNVLGITQQDCKKGGAL